MQKTTEDLFNKLTTEVIYEIDTGYVRLNFYRIFGYITCFSAFFYGFAITSFSILFFSLLGLLSNNLICKAVKSIFLSRDMTYYILKNNLVEKAKTEYEKNKQQQQERNSSLL